MSYQIPKPSRKHLSNLVRCVTDQFLCWVEVKPGKHVFASFEVTKKTNEVRGVGTVNRERTQDMRPVVGSDAEAEFAMGGSDKYAAPR